MTTFPLSFSLGKLRDLKWSVTLLIIIAVGTLGWFIFSSVGEAAMKSVEEYSDDLTYITIQSKPIPVDVLMQIESPEALEVDEILKKYSIPKEMITSAGEIPHVERAYPLHVFDVGVILLEGKTIDNHRLIQMYTAVVLGLDELPPFMIGVVEGHLPRSGAPEIALLSWFKSEWVKIGGEVKVFISPITGVAVGEGEEMIVKAQAAKISGFFAFSAWSPVQSLIHKDFLDSAPMGDAVLRRTISRDCVNTLVIKFDDVRHAEETLREVRALFEGYPMLYDEYLLGQTRKLVELSKTFGSALSYSSLLLSAGLFILVGYLSFNARRWELGLLRSLGFKVNEIRNAYLFYSIVIGAMGCATGLLLARAVQGIIPSLLDIQQYRFEPAIEPTIGISEIGLAFVLAISVSAVSILVAIALAMRRSVEEDLREF